MIGSIRAARHAGTPQATKATIANTSATMAKVDGSFGAMP
jgi:hypothetical protein